MELSPSQTNLLGIVIDFRLAGVQNPHGTGYGNSAKRLGWAELLIVGAISPTFFELGGEP